ncbi:lytic murein transglycosylase [Propylenella binzhouense]|uniref:Lytic murein transglycosylase n=1 Tax=Propylenella binzhouense TaxID=2555902 RepID=A0A964TAR7_9HYPH|nr:lytic murein transglycosylase [Propylenella binzhouense]MYZ50412.1 lytic murein transglycosylase [Propylenella binzhouense]
MNRARPIRTAVLLLAMGAASPGLAQTCGTGDFDGWLRGIRQEAAAAGVSERGLAGLDGVRFDPSIVKRDRGQGVFAQSFLEFAGRMVAKYRLDQGAKLMRQHAATFGRIEQQYGVPAPVITAFWGLETDFGANQGEFPTLTALATLAYDCRRPDLFRTQLVDALRIIDRGDLSPAEMTGAWAGEIGQMQFSPSDYLRYAVDADGDGRRDLRHDTADALASAANLLANAGWRRGEPWLEEVRVPQQLPWDQAGLTIRHPRSQWAAWGVAGRDGPLPADALPAALVLPMGRNGPAFLAYPNFDAFLDWNQSLVYATTAAYFATRLAGAPPVSKGRGAEAMSSAEVKALQRLLANLGYDVGKADGVIGSGTRAAVRDVQIKLGLPADAWPTAELLRRLGG